MRNGFAADDQFLAGIGMLKPELRGVKHQPVKTQFFPRELILFAVAMPGIAEDGMP